jgi:hypothetical protein
MKRSLSRTPEHRGAASSRRYVWSAAIGALLLSLTVVGCAGSLDPGVTGNGGGAMGGNSGAACQDTIFMNKCVFCHGAASNSAGLDLETADPGARMLGAPTGAGTSCPGGTLLKAGTNPAEGIFVEKITTPTCGSKMPIGPALSTAEVTCLTTWATTVTTGSP